MLTINTCDKCGSTSLRPSRIRSAFGHVISILFVPYRCRVCDHRQLKFSFITVEDSHAHEGAGVTATPRGAESATVEKPVAGVE
jgi:hypothetical protein